MRTLRTFTSYTIIVLLATACASTSPGTIYHGKYRTIPTGKHDAHEEPGAHSTDLIRRRTGDQFAGEDRRDSKTSMSTGVVETYPSISALRSALPAEKHMLELGITRAPGSKRTPEEDHNVTVVGSIYAIRKESDNDFHLIVGDNDCNGGGCLITVELSGLPSDAGNPSLSTLAAVRSKFLAFFGENPPGTSRGYDKFDPAIPVSLTGSLFFDVDHRAGIVGPAGLKPNSAWEIHPLTAIEFEQ
jgi:hypothetical protein